MTYTVTFAYQCFCFAGHKSTVCADGPFYLIYSCNGADFSSVVASVSIVNTHAMIYIYRVIISKYNLLLWMAAANACFGMNIHAKDS